MIDSDNGNLQKQIHDDFDLNSRQQLPTTISHND